MKKKNILLVIFIFTTILSILIIKPINDLDEIWNYNTARAISEGLIPYKDISMITTPLLPMVTAIFLKLIANEVIVSRVLAATLWTGIIFTIYKIFKLLIKEENITLIYTLLIGILCRNIFCIDYNVTVLLMALIILYQELKDIENISQYNIKKDLILGILAGLAICTKQSIGATLAVIFVIYKLVFVESKEQFKQYLKIAIRRVIGILIPVAMLVLYLIITGSISEFINYAVLGISTFSNKISYVSLLQSNKIEIRVLSIVVPVSIIMMAITLLVTKVLKKENEKIQNLLTFLLYSLSIIIVMYPISDEIHFLIGSLISIIGLIYMISIFGKIIYNKINYKKKYKIYKIITLCIAILITSLILTVAINNIYTYLKINKNTEKSHFKNIEIKEYLNNRISEIDKFILEKEKQGQKVYILDAEAALYMVPIDKYNKDYDMFLKGNIGKDGEDGQIEKIKQRQENELYLIRNENLRQNWQTPLNVINYIRENFELVEKISIYEVYK